MRSIAVALVLCSSLSCLAADPSPPCSENPYVIQTERGKLSIKTTLPPSLIGPSAKPDGTSAEAALQFTRSMYADMAPGVISEVLGIYTCWVERAIEADATKTPEQKRAIKDAWDAAVIDISITSSRYFTAFVARYDTVDQLNPAKLKESLDADGRSPSAYLSAIKQENFLITSGFEGWISGTINGISGTVCGTYLRRALATNAAAIQHVAASVRPVLANYFADKKSGVIAAKAMLYTRAASSLLLQPPTDEESLKALSQCAALGSSPK
jgi:hypothetical protein